MGFGPQLVDFDGDGDDDLLSGNWIRQIILFRRQPDGSFSAGEPIADGQGEPITVDYGVTAFACDWDGDRDLDLLAGTTSGDVYLVLNTGSRTEPIYDRPQALTAARDKISASGGDSAPALADWDGDGRPDLLMGTGEGSVLWCRNIGTLREPELAKAEILVPPPDKSSERGERAKICVTDWNGDGHLDLLVGDFGKEFRKELSEEEERWRDEVRQQQADLLEEWARNFGEYRKLLSAPEPDSDDLRRQRQQKVDHLRNELHRLKQVRDKFDRTEQALEPGMQNHGRVWLFLRKAS